MSEYTPAGPRWMNTVSMLAEDLTEDGYTYPRMTVQAPSAEVYDALPVEEQAWHCVGTQKCEPDTEGAQLHRQKTVEIDEIAVTVFPQVWS